MEEIMELGIFQLNELLCSLHSEYMDKLDNANDYMREYVWNKSNYFPRLEVEHDGLLLYMIRGIEAEYGKSYDIVYTADKIASAYIRAISYYDVNNGWDFTAFPQAWILSEMLRREYHKTHVEWADDPWFLSEEKYWEIRNHRAMHGRPERSK